MEFGYPFAAPDQTCLMTSFIMRGVRVDETMTEDIDIESVLTEMARNRRRPEPRLAVTDPGVYALYLAKGARLPGVETQAGAVLYVGMTEDGLDVRYHFGHKDSSFSSPRRSFGALLKNSKLKLVAHPRGKERTRRAMTHYRFSDGGEERLTAWMLENLEFSLVPLKERIPEVEENLIKRLKPPLNLNRWPNPQAPAIKKLRKQCAEEAAKAAS